MMTKKEPMKFLSYRRGLEHEWPELSVMDPRTMLEWKSREHSYIAVFTIAEEHALLSISDLVGMKAYQCPAYQTTAEEI